eukprot:GHVR01150395.1.p1 GENE.GHVR01150395.1~~GHVR01150395.1.p1  ORF type:complete len:130 (-),score=1.75 GHVR01150395.1:191-580(-)
MRGNHTCRKVSHTLFTNKYHTQSNSSSAQIGKTCKQNMCVTLKSVFFRTFLRPFRYPTSSVLTPTKSSSFPSKREPMPSPRFTSTVALVGASNSFNSETALLLSLLNTMPMYVAFSSVNSSATSNSLPI